MPLHEDGTGSSWACISHSRSRVIHASFPVPSTQPGIPGIPGWLRHPTYTATPAAIDYGPHWVKENPKRLIFGFNITLAGGLGHLCPLARTVQLWRGETEKSRSDNNVVEIKATVTQRQVVANILPASDKEILLMVSSSTISQLPRLLSSTFREWEIETPQEWEIELVLRQVLNSSLKAKLSELGDIVCDLGEEDIGNFLKTICDSPDATFFKAVTTAIRRQNTRKPTQHEFFQSFTLKDQALSDEQVSSLATITKNWELDDNKLEELKKSAVHWISEPRTFFDSETTECPGWHGLLEFCFYNSQQIEDVSPVRRVVNSIKVFESIEAEVRAQCLEYKKNHQESLEPQEPTKILSRVLNSATEKICRQLPKEKIKEQRSKLYSQYSRGKKWAQIEPCCMVLSLQSTAVRRFERRKWASIEISALNAYIEHLRAFSMRDSLSMAYMRIHEEYVRRSSPQNRSTNSSQAIDGRNGKQKRAVSSLGLPPGKKRRTRASRAHVGPSSNPPSNIEKNTNDHQGPSNRFWIRPVFEPSTSTITGFNDTAQQTSANHLGNSNHIENRRSTSPTYSCPSGSGARECHNASFSEQVPINNNNPSGNHHSAYGPAYYPMQSEPTLAGTFIQQCPHGYGESVNPSVEGDVYPNPGYGQSVNPSIEGNVYSNSGYGESVNPSVEGDVYPNPGYGLSTNPSVEGNVYSNPGYGQSANPSVEGNVYSNPGYGESVNPSVEGNVYSNPGYGESVNPSVEGDVYPNPGYGLSTNPSVEGNVYSNPGYGESVNPSVEGDVYPIIF
ncbi:hypothetical protein ACJ73_08689 [Blastomyces percursus]|uniref:Uncharacterized protein n=1 Tax=Blastomyces percursus TaxID=1658174 RepID=A0A1J9PQV6_9EURO|nr:hypothetical protein ACJ73_08689 [Blastomyces percursus]